MSKKSEVRSRKKKISRKDAKKSIRVFLRVLRAIRGKWIYKRRQASGVRRQAFKAFKASPPFKAL